MVVQRHIIEQRVQDSTQEEDPPPPRGSTQQILIQGGSDPLPFYVPFFKKKVPLIDK